MGDEPVVACWSHDETCVGDKALEAQSAVRRHGSIVPTPGDHRGHDHVFGRVECIGITAPPHLLNKGAGVNPSIVHDVPPCSKIEQWFPSRVERPSAHDPKQADACTRANRVYEDETPNAPRHWS